MLLINLIINFFSIATSVGLECVTKVNQKCMSRPQIIDVNNNEPVFYPYRIKVNKCSGSCNTINDPYAKLCVTDITKNINVKVFNVVARINETRQIIWHETCKCVCRLTSAVCNSRQIWNEDKCGCECKEDLINKLVCGKGYIWNPSNCACECDKLCDFGQYLDYKNCVYRKGLVDKLVEECIDVIGGDTMYNKTLSIDPNDCPSHTPYIVLLSVFLLISVIVGSTIIFFHWYKNKLLDLKDFSDITYSKTEKEIY